MKNIFKVKQSMICSRLFIDRQAMNDAKIQPITLFEISAQKIGLVVLCGVSTTQTCLWLTFSNLRKSFGLKLELHSYCSGGNGTILLNGLE